MSKSDAGAREKFVQLLSAGGPYAFPSTVALPAGEGADAVHIPGVTLRDWLAAQALAGYCANPSNRDLPATLAQRAYQAADAMMKARTPTPETSTP